MLSSRIPWVERFEARRAPGMIFDLVALDCPSVRVNGSCFVDSWIPFGDHPLNLERYRED